MAAPQNVTHPAMLCGQAAMPLWSSNTRVDGLGRAPLAALAAIFLLVESSLREVTCADQGNCGAGIPACTEGAAFARLERMQPGWLHHKT